jgi:tRNA pseudouridine38-40 synthase
VGRLALVVSYDGASFAGSQVQPGERTVQEELEQALRFLAPEWTSRSVFAGRTDRGVHAAGQVVSLEDIRPDLPVETIRRAVNNRLPDDVAVRTVARMGSTFHARYDARWREYRYRIWFGQDEPLARRLVWRKPGGAPDLGAMERAASLIAGTHDFAAFAGGGEGVPGSTRSQRPRGTVRTMFASEIRTISPWWGPAGAVNGWLIEYRVAGDGFLPQMVRALVSALVAVGRGERSPEWMGAVLEAKDRRQGGGVAPPQGLIFWQVGYRAFGDSAGAMFEADTPRNRPTADDPGDTTRSNGRGTANLVPEGA